MKLQFRFKLYFHWPLLVLLVVSLIAHHVWLSPSSTLTYSDWLYWTHDATAQLWNSWGTWLSNQTLGSVNIQIPFLFFNSIWSLFAHLGYSFDAAVKFTFLIPIAIFGVLSPYYLTFMLYKNRTISFALSLFYATIPYFLVKQTAHLPIAMVFSIAPLILALFIKSLTTNRSKDWLLFVLTFWVCTCYEIRISVIVAGILIVYYLFNHITETKKYFKNIIIAATFLLGLSLFWLLPTLLGGASGSIEAVAGQGLFGNPLFDLQHAFTIMESSWTGSYPNENFISQPVKLYFYLSPLLAFGAIHASAKSDRKQKIRVLSFIILSLIGVFLTKQSQEPVSIAYRYLYTNVPGFNLFREASKYYLITSIGYLVLIGYTLSYLYSKHKSGQKKLGRIFYALIAGLCLVSFINLLPLFTNHFGTLFQSRTEPHDYVTLNDFISSQPDYFRTYWYPSVSRWGDFSNQHPKISAADTTNSTFSQLSVSNHNQIASEKINDFAKSSLMQPLADDMSVKYFIVPGWDPVNSDDVFNFYGEDRQTYINTLNQLPWLKKINIGTKQIVVYENKTYQPYISATDSIVRLKNASELTDNPLSLQSVYGSNVNYLLSSDSNNKSTDTINDIFEGLTAKNFSPNQISVNTSTESNQSNALNVGPKPNIAYTINKGSINLLQTKTDYLTVNGDTVISNQPTTTLASTGYDKSAKNYISDNNDLQLLPNVDGSYEYPSDSKNAGLYSTDQPNIISDPSFETGLWTSKVADCNNFDGNPEIYATRTNSDQTNGYYSLELGAGNHTACTGQSNIPVSSGSYEFSFDYQATVARHAGYSISFNDPKHTTNTYDLPLSDKTWHSVLAKINIPIGATTISFKIYGYPDDQQQKFATTRYDNFSLQHLKTLADLTISENNAFTSQPITSGSKQIAYTDPSYSFKNLISNPSFENGAWQSKVGDCNNYDNKPALGMTVTNQQHTAGSKALQLSAKRHVACTNPNDIAVKGNQTYNISFDYKALDGAAAGYTIAFDDVNHIHQTKQFTWTSNSWKSESEAITVPQGSTKMILTIYAYANQYADKTMTVDYDNFYVTSTPQLKGQYYLSSNLKNQTTIPKKISFTSSMPTEKNIKVASATYPFYLKMAESYNANWALKSGNYVIPSQDHYDLNNFENAWYVNVDTVCKFGNCTRNDDGSYDMHLAVTYTPQHYFNEGIIVSTVTLFISIIFVTFSGIKRFSRKSINWKFRR